MSASKNRSRRQRRPVEVVVKEVEPQIEAPISLSVDYLRSQLMYQHLNTPAQHVIDAGLNAMGMDVDPNILLSILTNLAAFCVYILDSEGVSEEEKRAFQDETLRRVAESLPVLLELHRTEFPIYEEFVKQQEPASDAILVQPDSESLQ